MVEIPRFGMLIEVYIVAFVTIHIYEISVATKITTPIGIGPAASICSDTSVTHGYKCEEHDVVTKDGYILRLQRIPEGLKEGKNTKHTKKQPVFLQHGILVSGVYWMLNHEAEQCLPFILADQGYDVWLANSRGNRFSARHVKLDPNGPEFWDWSWDEMTEYDLPDSIGFVVNNTGQKVYYIGHSLGTTTAMAAFSKGLLIDKVKSAVLLCPVAYLNHMTTVITKAAADIYLAEFFLQQGIAEVDFAYEPIRTLLKLFCGTPGIDCFDFVTLFTGPNCCINASTIEFFLNNEPQPTALKNLAHLSQGVRTGKFCKYDYGSAKENIKRYGQAEAPIYNLTHIPPALPLFIVYGLYDTLADIDDVQELFNTLQLHTVQRLYIDKYAHCDFINAVDAKDLVFNHVLAFLNSQRGY